MNINTEHEERKTVDSDGDEDDWCIVPHPASPRPFNAKSSQMADKYENDTLNDEFDFCVISSSDNEGDEGCIIVDKYDLPKHEEEELYTANGRKELGKDILRFSHNHFQLKVSDNPSVTTTLLHQANFRENLNHEKKKITYSDISNQENNKESVISPDFLIQILQKSQGELDARNKSSENHYPNEDRYLIVNSHQDDFCEVTKEEAAKFDDVSTNVIPRNFLIESLQELEEELNSEDPRDNELNELEEEYQLLDWPQDCFCEDSLADVVPCYDEASKKSIIPNNFLPDILSELQNELINKVEAENNILLTESYQTLDYPHDDFCKATLANVASYDEISEFKSCKNEDDCVTNSFEEFLLSICPSNTSTESDVEGISEEMTQQPLNSENGLTETSLYTNNSSTTLHYYEFCKPYRDDIDLLLEEYYEEDYSQLKTDKNWMKYEDWDSHPTRKNKCRKVSPFNRQEVRSTMKRMCYKGHWNCKMKSYFYS